MSNLHDAVLELIETQSINPADYDSAWGMYMDANSFGEIDILIDARAIKNRDELVKWVCDGNLEYLDMACADSQVDHPLTLLRDANVMYLHEVAFNAVVYAYFNV